MNRDVRDASIAACGLEHIHEEVRRLFSPALVLQGQEESAANHARERKVASRFGGLPDLPRGAAWPAVDDIPLMFVAQIHLQQLVGLDGAEVLPEQGLLSFFFDGALTGYERGEVGDRCRVLWSPESSALEPRSPPDTLPHGFRLFESRELAATETWTLPSIEEVSAEEFPTILARTPVIPVEDAKSYEALRKRFFTYETRLLGHPDELQGGELRFNAVLRRDTQHRFRYEDYEWTNEDRLVAEMSELVLLMQSTRDPETGTDWGNGIVYFWIDEQDLAACRFDRAFAVFQST